MVVNDTNHRGGKCPNYLFLHHIGDFWERNCHLQQLSSPKRLTARYQDSYVCVYVSLPFKCCIFECELWEMLQNLLENINVAH